jgi:serine/threonine protein phosphatase PrpC
MVICPKCKAENRPEAAFCSRCGTILFVQPASSKLPEQPTPAIPSEQAAPAKTQEPLPSFETQEQAVQSAQVASVVIPRGLQAQPEGSIFGDRFRNNALLFQDEHEINYTVTEISRPDIPPVQICSNPECRTIHSPVGPEPENFCTQCGHPLEEQSLLFMLEENDTDRYDTIQPVIDLHLVHPNIHPPVATFQQELPGGVRYYLVTPYSRDLPSESEISDVLGWGIQLAKALDYLQAKGIAFGEELGSSSIGLVENNIVWRNFKSARVLPMLTDREKINNVRMLALALYFLITGRSTYCLDPYLPASLNDLFEKALVGEGFVSGADIAQQIELAKSGGVERLILDYQVGRRTHPGKVRAHNEDSLLSIELSSIHQGTITPCGLFAIADGMGGHASGDLASGLVIKTITQKAACEIVTLQNPLFEDQSNWLKQTVQAANQAVYEARQNAGNDMGTTLVLGLLIGIQAYLTHLGDSRIYLVNKGSIQQLTTDHSLVQHMVTIGQISSDEARYHPQRNVIYRSLGEKPEVGVDCLSQQLFPHDRLLLCSDGLTNVLDDQKLQKIILEANSPQAACDLLIEAANSAGGEDNISVIVIEIISV